MTRDKKWADLGRLLGYTGIPGLATQMRNSYSRVILPYEQFVDRVRNSPALSPNKPRDPNLKTHSNLQSGSILARPTTPVNRDDDDSPPSSPLSSTSSPLSEPPDDADMKDANGSKGESSRPRRSTRHNSQERVARMSFGRYDETDWMLIMHIGTRRTSTANAASTSLSELPEAQTKSSKHPSEVRHGIVCPHRAMVVISESYSYIARSVSRRTKERRC